MKSTTEDNYSVLHILFTQVFHNLSETISLFERFIKLGVDINILGKNNILAINEVINMKYLDSELEPIYDLFFFATLRRINYSKQIGIYSN